MPNRGSSCAYAVEHDTRYVYGAVVATSQHIACLRPRATPGQRVHASNLAVEPEAATTTARVDYFGNTIEQFTVLRPHRELVVRARSLVEVEDRGAPRHPNDSPAWEDVRDAFVYRKVVPGQRKVVPGRREAATGQHEAAPGQHEAAPGQHEAEFVFPSPYIGVAEQSRAYAEASFVPGRPLLAAAVDLMHRMHEDFTFDPDATTVTTPVTRVLAERRGVCQDLAHVMISCFRSYGLPARYVSGYVLTDPPPGEERLLGADASHAWVSVHCPSGGWVDLDPTNDVLPGTRHVVVGWGRDYGDVCPLRGVFVGGAEHRLEIGVSMIPLDEQQLQRALSETIAEPPLGFST